MGRPLERNEPAQPLLRFTSRHMDIIRRLVAGQTQTQIARDLGYTDGRLSIIVNSPLFQIKLRAFEKEVNDKVVDNVANFELRVRKLQEPALDVIEGLMTKSKNERLKRDCAKDVLELGGNINKKRDEDGMNEFARIISDAFKAAAERNTPTPNEQMINITPTRLEEETNEYDLTLQTSDTPSVEVEQEQEQELAQTPQEQINTLAHEKVEKQTINKILNALLKD